MATLLASLLFKPSLFPIPSLPFSYSSNRFQFSRSSPYPNNYDPLPLSPCFLSTGFRKPGFFPAIFCALRPESAGSGPESAAPVETPPAFDEPKAEKEFPVESSGFGEELNAAESGEKSGVLVGKEGEENKSRLPFVIFLMGLWARVRSWFERTLTWDWLSLWPFWRQEKRLERLIAEADANPSDAVKQSALLAELNKQSPESVLKRFEQRDHAVDSRGVVEYVRALVVTNAIVDYLPDEESGKPSSLPSLGNVL